MQGPNKEILIASWNIEKNGQSSDPTKQEKVSSFINFCATFLRCHIIFICEVHSARVDDYVSFLIRTYGEYYDVPSLPGGKSNAYVFMIRRDYGFEGSYFQLKGLNRNIVLLRYQGLAVVLAHFKSGRTGLTKDQLVQAANYCQEISPNKWAITGDMNWDLTDVSKLNLAFTTKVGFCYKKLNGQPDQTQKSGGILDWILAGHNTYLDPADLVSMVGPQNAYLFDMKGPDHKPIVFTIRW